MTLLQMHFLVTPFCQTAPLQPFAVWQQNVMEYCCKDLACTVIPLTSAYDVVGQHNKVGGITFKATFVHLHEHVDMNAS